MMRSIKSLPISQLLALSCLLAVTGVDGKVVVGTTRNEETNGTVSVVDIQDHNKTQYFNQNFQEGNYNYGYDIRPSGPNGQFHHENKAADGVVYGCYGYLDPNNQAQITFYVSDAWGYRPVRQEQPVEVFFPAQNPEGTTDMKGDTIQWGELIFPEKCTYFAQQVAVAASSNVGQTLVGTPFSLSPGTPPFPIPAVNRRPLTPNTNQFTTPIVVTPLGGTGNSRPSTEQIRNPNPSIRTPTSPVRAPSPTIQTPFAPIRNPTPISFIPTATASTNTGIGNTGSRNPAENGTQTPTTTALPVLTSTTASIGNQSFGPDGKGNNQNNDGSGRFPGNAGFSTPGKTSPNSNGFSGTTSFIDNSSPGPNSLSTDNRRQGGSTSFPGAGTSTLGGGPTNGVTPIVQLGGRGPSSNTGLGNRNTDGNGNKFGNVGPTKLPISSASVTPNGGIGSTPFTQYQPQTTGGLRNPTEGPNVGTSGGPGSSFYTEGSSSSIYPEGNHLSPGSQPSSSNNVGETLEQEVEGSSSAIFPGRKTNSGTGNKLAPLKVNPNNGGSSTSNGPSGNSRPTTSQTPNTSFASENPTRNGNTQPNGLNNFSGTGSNNGGINPNQGAFTNKPSGQGSTGQFNPDKTPGFTSVPILPLTSLEELREPNTNSPFTEDSSNTCPQVCNSCNQQPKPEEIDYSQIPGAVVANVPVIFYPDCSTNAFSRPAVVPFCPSKQQASCSNQQPLTMKFPTGSSFNGNSNGPAARNAFASTLPSRTSRRVIRKTRHSQPDI